MPRVDKFIQAAFKAGADRIVFASGEKAMAVTSSGSRPMTAQPASLQQVTDLLKEITPAGDPGGDFRYESPAGPVRVLVSGPADGLRLEIEAWDSGAAPVTDASVATATTNPTTPEAAKATAAPSPSGSVPSRALGQMERLLRRIVEDGCSDLHLSSGNSPLYRKDGDILALGSDSPVSAEEMPDLLFAITPERYRKQFEENRDTDFAYEIADLARFRCNLFMDRIGMGGVFRVIPSKIPTTEDLGLSRSIVDLCYRNKGLVLVTGPTGSGKSTTLAAMIDHINANRTAHVITIEDPIEFVHDNRKCLINQREVGVHTVGFKTALRAALREDPDIVLVGEMRDLETVAIAIETAETGHLVFGTLHTNTAASTVDRIIDQFPTDRQAQVRTMLSESLQGVISQTLCRKKGGGRVAALEILLVNAAVSNLIREAKTFQIPSIMQTGRGAGMITMTDALVDLVNRKVVDRREAYAKAINKAELKAALGRNGIDLEAPHAMAATQTAG